MINPKNLNKCCPSNNGNVGNAIACIIKIIKQLEKRDSIIENSIDEEKSRAIDAENTLQQHIEEEINRAQTKEEEILLVLNNQNLRTEQTETTLSNKIEEDILTEKTRAEQAENIISSNLTEEIAARKQAITNVINSIPEAQILPDWNLSDVNAKDFIKNKPHALDGKSAYELAVDNGFEGTEQEWLASLKGEQGVQGIQGEQGPAGQDGADGQDGAPGLDGHSPVVTASKSGSTTTIYVDGTSIATIEDGLNGQDGQNGTNGTNGTNGLDGVTPHIDSTTGNWFIGNTDTGVHALGPAGLDGSSATIGTNNLLHTPINHNGHAYVDLGLPSGTLWATMNIGASSETDYGNYYMYGKGATQFNLSDSTYTGREDPLDLSVDTARLVWGGSWHMPTDDLIQELITNTTYEWTTVNGINGGKFTSTNGNYIFFPASGEIYSANYHGNAGLNPHLGDEGRYWSSTPATDISSNIVLSRILFISGPNGTWNYTMACKDAASIGSGCTIRAVLGGALEIASKVAITGSYNDLTDKPEIPNIEQLELAVSAALNNLDERITILENQNS